MYNQSNSTTKKPQQRGVNMNEQTESSPQKKERSSIADKKIAIINIAFFALLLAGIIIVPLSGVAAVIVIALLVFTASVLYTYLF